MTTVFQRHELPIAFSMVTAARRIRPRRDGQHSYHQYFLLWTAFNNIYSTITQRQGLRTEVITNEDGSVATTPNGHVNIPRVAIVGEREQIYCALKEFDGGLKHALILHESTQYFVKRSPYWEGSKIKLDAFNQKVNGVININYTSDPQYPVWSPIDIQYYQEYLENPDNQDINDFLTRQVVDLLYTVRTNLMYSARSFNDANDNSVIENALQLLELIVTTFLRL